ncbi:ABC-type multidrug transport system fused ATPase/permease subunit [Nocardiopsis mwathae]|uniref:ABC-type multidrug transport system fused ATPase/permease subunit n=1 Tax=Nocardiopsis mwathae TaxID=1472723 RepID=A0A7X0D6W9_9ACTN|nr:ABC transporter ATP-binding protein [Nocardiopsis mwathae]MBB6173808.1 ABC-type multidrug transport system fused ATPase/permease subunit [Nocardiopsis mwathae]
MTATTTGAAEDHQGAAPHTPDRPHREILPITDSAHVRRRLAAAGRTHWRILVSIVALHAVAAIAGLAAPWLLGTIIDAVRDGTTAARIDLTVALIAVAVLVHAAFTYGSVAQAIRFGEGFLAELREDFMRAVLRLPLAKVERAGTGDLVTRTGRDIGHLAHVVRYSLPETIIAVVTCTLTIAAIGAVHPLLLLPALTSVPVFWLGTRWYLRRAPRGYDRELATYGDLTQGMTDTVEGAHTIEALRRAERMTARGDANISRAYAAERYTLWLRSVWFPILDFGYGLPVAATFLMGGWLYTQDVVTLGQATAATLFTTQLIQPLDRLIMQLDSLMYGFAAMRRLLGVRLASSEHPATGHDTATAAAASPARVTAAAAAVELRDVRFAYRPDQEVLHGVDLALRPGERLAMVGPSGAGKSTLGKLIAGIHGPTSGTVLVDGTDLAALPAHEQRSRVVLVTQETHVFGDTLGENVALAREGDVTAEEIWAALEAVDAADWVRDLPEGLDTRVGTGALELDPAHTQQLALARLVLADPRVLILDEATSLIDPGAARRLERSLNGVLEGRTVVAIAHRLHTAHDADRIAVVENGGITELGTHDELLARNGSYASLWRTWHGE